MCLLLSAIIKSGLSLLISSKLGCLRVPTEVYFPILSLNGLIIRFFLLSSAIPTGLTSKATNASTNEYSRTTTRLGCLGTFVVPSSCLISTPSFDDSLLELLELLFPHAAVAIKTNNKPITLKIFKPLTDSTP